MYFHLKPRSTLHYRPIPTENDDSESEPSPQKNVQELGWDGLALIIVFICVFGTSIVVSMLKAYQIGVLRGYVLGLEKAGGHANIELNSISRLFQYNRTFGDASSEVTNLAWEELFPKQGGFFKHPTLAPTRSQLSVFHELYCLNRIRRGYWALYNAAKEGHQLNEDSLSTMSSPSYIRPCIDLLRNSLMCQPDTTVEVKDDAIGEIGGFGILHKCKDWGQLQRWMAEWETYEQEKS